MTADRMYVRSARPDDEQALSELSLAARRTALHIPWTDLRRALVSPAPVADLAGRPHLAGHRTVDIRVGERGGQIGCLWVSITEPASVAQLRALVVHDDWPLAGTLDALLPPIRRALRQKGVTTLAFVGVERWLLEGLAVSGFAQTNTVVAMQKSGWDIPAAGNRAAVVRPVTEQDLPAIVEIDRQAFTPLWRNTPLTLAEFMQTSPYFCVAELERQIAGYAYGSLTGRHGHLTRIAVHPHFHGRQIGVRLLADVVRFFRNQRVFGITVNTQHDNVRARRLYEWFGFVLLGQEAEVWAIAP
jgi:ribosomal-protein-alanine N-acetyltransferase